MIVLVLVTGVGLASTRAAARPSDAPFPVSIENCGISITYAEAPRRAFTLNQTATEVMLALGLQDRMIGTAFLDDAILPEFAEAYKAIPVRSAAYPSSDVLFKSRTDFVYAAYPSAFSNEVPGIRDVLEAGTNSYLSPSGCQGRATADPTERVFDEIREVARIFGVLPRAERLIEGYRSDLERIRTSLGSVTTPRRVLWWDSGLPPAVAGCCGTPNEILRLAGAHNVFSDMWGTWGTVMWDEVIARNPEVIVLVDATWATAAQKRQWLMSQPKLAGISAVKNQRFVTVSFSASTPGIRNVATVRRVAEALYPEKFRAVHSTSE
jgi:iron complex transport system substrate-binding protein